MTAGAVEGQASQLLAELERAKAHRYRPRRIRLRQEWTREEDDELCAVWPRGGLRAARAVFPYRGVWSICHRARLLLGAIRCRRWTAAEDARLRDYWDAAYTLPKLGRMFHRTALAVYERAQHLGLPLGCPRGYEYLTTAARRVGCADAEQLRRVLDAHVVNWRRRPLSLSGRGRRRALLVERDTVDAAVQDWVRS